MVYYDVGLVFTVLALILIVYNNTALTMVIAEILERADTTTTKPNNTKNKQSVTLVVNEPRF